VKRHLQNSPDRYGPSGELSETSAPTHGSRWWRPDFAWALGTIVLTSVLLIPLLRLWEMDLRVPFNYARDGLFSLLIIKGILKHGWYLTNPDVGAPFGLQFYDFPLGAYNFQFLALKVLGGFSSDPALVLNLYFLLSFPLVALSAFVVLRWLGASGAVATVCSLIYALAPYHFLRGIEGHLFLSAYYSVPVGAYLVLSLFSDEPLFVRRIRAGSRAFTWISKRSLFTLALCALVASSGLYYAVFTMMLLIAATLLVVITQREARTLIKGGLLVGTILGVLTLNMAPSLAYQFAHGPNEAVAHRAEQESETQSLKLTSMVLPAPGHHIDALSNLADHYYRTTPLPSEGAQQSLGLIATLGFGWLLLVALAGCLSPRRGIGDERHRWLAALTATAFLIGTTGGISSLFAYLVSPQIRAWARISIFIAFFAIAAVALLLDSLQRRLGRPLLVGTLLVGVLLVGLYDQSGAPFVPDYAAAKGAYNNDEIFVEKIDSQLPPRAEILQLPYVPFPENPPVNKMTDYDLVRPYIHESDLRWSYAAMKGRPTDWHDDLADEPTNVLPAAASAAGFEGIYIDRFGYPDGAAELENELSELLKAEPLVSPNGRMSFFSLLTYKERLQSQYSSEKLAELKTATLMPISASFEEGFWPLEQDGESSWRWMKRTEHITLQNPSAEPRTALLWMILETASPQDSTVIVSLPDGTMKRLEVGPEGVALQLRARLRTGANEITLETDAPLTQSAPGGLSDQLALRVIDPAVEDAAFASLP
jgi:phosphoglycerol transferase